jgi:alpha-1,2-mannosyltransferase
MFVTMGVGRLASDMETRGHPGFELTSALKLTVFVGITVAATTTLYHNAVGGIYGWDFHGIWHAAQVISRGQNPYPAAHAHQLRKASNPYVLPPLISLLTVPLSKLPFTAAIIIWNLIGVTGLLASLRLLGVRDWRVYLLSLCSFPFVSSLVLGQPDGVFALLAALAWRYRRSWVAGLAVGVLVAAKVLMWPLVLWLVGRRRISGALAAVISGAVITIGTWAIIGFDGFTSYPALLSADARGFETDSHSIVALAIRTGVSRPIALGVAILCAALAVAVLLRFGTDRDLSSFLAAIVAGLLVSPLMWSHYLVLLLVPLAIAQRRGSLTWLLVAAFWISPSEPPASPWQVAAVLVIFAGLALFVALHGRTVRQPGPLPARPS